MSASHRPLLYRAALGLAALSMLALSGCVYPYGYGGYGGYGGYYAPAYAYPAPAVVVGVGGGHWGGRWR